jgi:hypothetical protein
VHIRAILQSHRHWPTPPLEHGPKLLPLLSIKHRKIDRLLDLDGGGELDSKRTNSSAVGVAALIETRMPM